MELHVVTITLISSRCNYTNNNEELYHVKIFCIYIAMPLTTCATMKQEKLDQSLQQYIGQSVIQLQLQLQLQLNLTQMGYRQAATVQTKNTLTYTILYNMYGFIICMFLLIRPISAQA